MSKIKKITQTKIIDGSTWYYLTEPIKKNYQSSDVADVLYQSCLAGQLADNPNGIDLFSHEDDGLQSSLY